MAVACIVCIFLNFISTVAFDNVNLIPFLIIRRNDSHLFSGLFILFMEEDNVTGLWLITFRSCNKIPVPFSYISKYFSPSCSVHLSWSIRENFWLQTGKPRIIQTEIHKCGVPICIRITGKLSVTGIAFVTSVLCNNVILNAFLISGLHLGCRYQIFAPYAFPLDGSILFIPDRSFFYICTCIDVTGVCMNVLFYPAGKLMLIAIFPMDMSFHLFLFTDNNAFRIEASLPMGMPFTFFPPTDKRFRIALFAVHMFLQFAVHIACQGNSVLRQGPDYSTGYHNHKKCNRNANSSASSFLRLPFI